MVSNIASNEDILKEADYYLNNDVTVKQASSDLGISKRTLQLHMKKLEIIAPYKFKLIQDKKISNERQGKIKGGTLGKRSASWTIEEAKEIAKIMVDNELTYEQAARKFGKPKSTIYEMTHNKGVDDEMTSSLLYGLAEANRRGIPLNRFLEQYYNKHVAIDKISNEMTDDNITKAGKK